MAGGLYSYQYHILTLHIQAVAVLSLSGGEPTLIPDLARATLKAGIFAAGEFYTATNDEGDIVGFTMWMPPGQELFSTLVLQAHDSIYVA